MSCIHTWRNSLNLNALTLRNSFITVILHPLNYLSNTALRCKYNPFLSIRFLMFSPLL